MSKIDHMWAVDLVARSVPGARWVKLLKVGEKTFTVAVRSSARCETDAEVRDKEAFLAGLHPDIWEVRLMRADRDGETYYVVFSKPVQMSF